MTRTGSAERSTAETTLRIRVDLDGTGRATIATPIGFLDHVLTLFARHALIDLEVDATGDTHVDEHHTVEDTALALGQALREALGDKYGIGRYGFTLPMDEALASAALDLGGRPCLVFDGSFRRERVGDLPTELVLHFFLSLCEGAGLNLHLEVDGDNDHHKVEACFKAVGRALRQAIGRDGRGLPSTKGSLGG